MMALEAVLADPNVDGALVIVTPQTSTEIVETARGVVDVCAHATKPILGCWMGKQEAMAGIDILAKNRVPNYHLPSVPSTPLEQCTPIASSSSSPFWSQRSSRSIERRSARSRAGTKRGA